MKKVYAHTSHMHNCLTRKKLNIKTSLVEGITYFSKITMVGPKNPKIGVKHL